MKPNNSKERRISFFKFLGLFLVTMLMIVGAVFFSYQIPKKENAELRAHTKVLEDGMVFQKNFYNEMRVVKSMLDSLDVPGQNVVYEKNLIAQKLATLEETIPTKDDTHLYDMHQKIITLFADLLKIKDRLYGLRDCAAENDEYREELDRVRSDLKEAQRDLRLK